MTASAARHLDLAKYEVRRVGGDVFAADDGNGAYGTHEVLARGPRRRVLVSWGEHRGHLLGTVRGSALTVLDFTEDAGGVQPGLTTYVRIENKAAAGLARALMAVLGGIVDRRLAAGFATTAEVAEWAVRQPDEFCAWLQGAAPSEPDATIVTAALPGCAVAAAAR